MSYTNTPHILLATYLKVSNFLTYIFRKKELKESIRAGQTHMEVSKFINVCRYILERVKILERMPKRD